MPPSRQSFLGDLSVVARGRDFRRLFAVRLVSQAGDGAFQVGLASLVFFSTQRATTPTAVAVAAVVTVVPYTLIGPFTGVLLDVWQRRQILLLANAVRAVLVVLVAATILGAGVGPPVYLTALICLSMNRFFLSGLGAALPHVVPRHELVMANAVSPTCGTVATMTGAAVGFGVRELLGAGDRTDAVIVLIAATGYALASLLTLRMPRTLLGPEQGAPLNLGNLTTTARDVLADLLAGARHVRARSAAADALTAIGLQRIGYGILTIAVMLLCRNHFGSPDDPDSGVALLARAFTALGAGVAAAAVLTPAMTTRIGTRGTIIGCLGTAAVADACFVVDATTWLLYGGTFVIGLTGQSIKICVDSVVQREVDDSFRGRVFSFYDVVFNVSLVSACGLSVLFLPEDGYSRPVFAAVAVLFAATAVGYRRRGRRRRCPGAFGHAPNHPEELATVAGNEQNRSGGPENRTPTPTRNTSD